MSVQAIERGASWGARAVRRLSAVAAASAVVIGLYLFREAPLAAAIVVTAVAAVPPVVLFLLAQALQGLAELPGRLRSTPGDARARLDEVSRIAGEANEARLARVPLLLWRLGKVAGSSRELLTPHAPLLPLASVPFLALAAASIAGAVLETAIALVVLVLLVA